LGHLTLACKHCPESAGRVAIEPNQNQDISRIWNAWKQTTKTTSGKAICRKDIPKRRT